MNNPHTQRIESYTCAQIKDLSAKLEAHRQELTAYISSYAKNPRPAQPWEHHTTICIKTFIRPQYLIRCIKSIRKFFHTVPIIVSDDSILKLLPKGLIEGGISSQHEPYFSFLTQARNSMVQNVKTKYTIIIDDDMEFVPATNWQLLYEYIESHPVDLVACRMNQRQPYDCLYVHTSDAIAVKDKQTLSKDAQIHHSHRALNCFIATTESLRSVQWDGVMHSTPEHTDFFCRYSHAGFKVCTHLGATIDENHNLDTTDYGYKHFRFLKIDYSAHLTSKYKVQNPFGYKMPTKMRTYQTTICQAHTAFTNIGIPFTVVCGTSLGYHRNRGFVSHDLDTDVAVRSEDLNIPVEEFVKKMRQEGFDKIRFFGTRDSGFEMSFVNRQTRIKLDVFVIFKTKHFDYVTCYYGQGYTRPFYIKIIPGGTKQVTWFGRKFNVWSKEQVYTHYGDTWRIPQKISYLEFADQPFAYIWNHDNGDIPDDGPIPIVRPTFITDFFECRTTLTAFDTTLPFKKSTNQRTIWDEQVQNKTPWTLVISAKVDLTQWESIALSMSEALRGRRSAQVVVFGAETEFSSLKEVLPVMNVTMAPARMYRPASLSCLSNVFAYAITWRAAEKALKTEAQTISEVEGALGDVMVAMNVLTENTVLQITD